MRTGTVKMHFSLAPHGEKFSRPKILSKNGLEFHKPHQVHTISYIRLVEYLRVNVPSLLRLVNILGTFLGLEIF